MFKNSRIPAVASSVIAIFSFNGRIDRCIGRRRRFLVGTKLYKPVELISCYQWAHMIEAISTGEKLNEIISEMKNQGLWKKEMPAWVTDYGKEIVTNQQDFAGWLQFVFLPNQLVNVTSNNLFPERNYIVLQAKRFFDRDVQKGRLLQLLIELDAML